MNEHKIPDILTELPVIDYNLCTHCNICVEVCPKGVISSAMNYTCDKCVKYCISMEVPCSPEHYVFNYVDCDVCGICVEHCPEKAMNWYKVKKK
jgi:Pyruvate/2-oxoacid:ferredoxin oxidoreductase delta subunit